MFGLVTWRTDLLAGGQTSEFTRVIFLSPHFPNLPSLSPLEIAGYKS